MTPALCLPGLSSIGTPDLLSVGSDYKDPLKRGQGINRTYELGASKGVEEGASLPAELIDTGTTTIGGKIKWKASLWVHSAFFLAVRHQNQRAWGL